MELLLQSGAKTDARDVAGRPPLHYAVMSSRPEAAKLLIRRGAPLAATDATGRTALNVVIDQV